MYYSNIDSVFIFNIELTMASSFFHFSKLFTHTYCIFISY